MGRFLFWLLVFGGAAAIFAFFFFTSAIGRPGPTTEPRTFTVEQGATGTSIAAALQSEGLIADPFLFRVANRLYASGATVTRERWGLDSTTNSFKLFGKNWARWREKHRLL
jgi:cell division protein YceG involved in septum cleavage